MGRCDAAFIPVVLGPIGMGSSTFTIEFYTLSDAHRRYRLDRLADDAFSVERIDDKTYVVTCIKPSQLCKVGWALFQTLLAKFCNVIAVSGDAEDGAKAYPKA